MEDDLDWLARNVHVWPAGDHQPWCYVYWKGGHRAVSANCITVIQSCVRIEKSEWLARRAELQNKPSWKDAPEWAEWLAQDEDGEWKWLAGLPGKYVDCWTAVKIKGCCKGIALGDWWDTLEKRPADLSSAAVIKRLDEATQNVLAAVPALMDEKYSFEPEFMPVSVSNETVQLDRPIAGTGTGMSIGEWAAKYSGKTPSAQIREAVLNEALRILRDHPDHFSADGLADLNELTGAELTKRDERVCGGQKYIDAHWFERGELPPVGTACEAFGKFPTSPCEIIAYSPEQVAIRWLDNGLLDVIDLKTGDIPSIDFLPIRTERQLTVDEMMAVAAANFGNLETCCEALYDAGYRKQISPAK